MRFHETIILLSGKGREDPRGEVDIRKRGEWCNIPKKDNLLQKIIWAVVKTFTGEEYWKEEKKEEDKS